MADFPAPVPGATRAAVAAGALFVDDAGRLLLVRPTYKDYWDIPGGYVEPGETPYEACRREIAEELGLEVQPGPLLAVDWAPSNDDGDKVLFVFDGGSLSATQLDNIELQRSELSEYRYVSVDELSDLTIERLAKRIRAALPSQRQGRIAYLEAGDAVPR